MVQGSVQLKVFVQLGYKYLCKYEHSTNSVQAFVHSSHKSVLFCLIAFTFPILHQTKADWLWLNQEFWVSYSLFFLQTDDEIYFVRCSSCC